MEHCLHPCVCVGPTLLCFVLHVEGQVVDDLDFVSDDSASWPNSSVWNFVHRYFIHLTMHFSLRTSFPIFSQMTGRCPSARRWLPYCSSRSKLVCTGRANTGTAPKTMVIKSSILGKPFNCPKYCRIYFEFMGAVTSDPSNERATLPTAPRLSRIRLVYILARWHRMCSRPGCFSSCFFGVAVFLGAKGQLFLL